MKSIFIAALIIVLIELFLFLRIDNEAILNNLHNHTLFTNNFGSNESAPVKQVIKLKADLFVNSKTDFLQIGDSSGFFGVQPKIIEKYFDNKEYINLSCCADAGWSGYALYLNYLLKKIKTEYVIFYFTPYSLPNQYKEGFSSNIKKYYGEHKIFDLNIINHLRSLYYRNDILDFVYKKSTNNSITDPDQFLNSLNVKNFETDTKTSSDKYLNYLKDSKGWLPYRFKDRKKGGVIKVGECDLLYHFYNKKRFPLLNKNLQKIADVTKKFNKKLIVIFNPVACSKSFDINPILADLEKFKKNNLNVIIPFEFITTYRANDFEDNQHLNPEASSRNSHRIGSALSKILNNKTNIN
tara:strand:- start:44 stop:1102 length:1059 start_codon:yes stop_codon:yes gene_type:complete